MLQKFTDDELTIVYIYNTVHVNIACIHIVILLFSAIMPVITIKNACSLISSEFSCISYNYIAHVLILEYMYGLPII